MKRHILFTACATALAVSSVGAAIIAAPPSTGSTPSTTFNSGADFWGPVTAIGPMAVNGIVPTGTIDITPPVGAFAGEDIDVGSGDVVTVSWTINLPGDAAPGTGLTNINFAGQFGAASAGVGPTFSAFFDAGEEFDFDFVAGAATSSVDFRPVGGPTNNDLAIDTNADNIGDGTLAIESGVVVNFADAGGATVTTTSVTFTGSFPPFFSGQAEEFWASGTLTADYDQLIPEPSSGLLALFGAGLLFFRRRR